MANRWGNNGNSERLYFVGSKITADGDNRHEMKRHLLLGRKVMTELDSIFKSRDITLPTKVCLVKAMVFPVVISGCESWTIKKAECRSIDALEVWIWRRLFFFFLWWILSYIEMKQPWVYMCSPSWSPLPPPSPPVPSRFSQCTRSERLSHASNMGWWSVSP